MALKSQASRRYAVALVETTEKAADLKLDAALEQLNQFAQLVESNFDLRNALLNPVFTAIERKKVLESVMNAAKFAPTMRRFIELVVDHDRVREIGEIAEAFQNLANERRGRQRAAIESAAPLSPESAERLKRVLEKSTGTAIELDITVNPELIGGLRARVGSLVFDGTIRSELDRLRTSLMQAE